MNIRVKRQFLLSLMIFLLIAVPSSTLAELNLPVVVYDEKNVPMVFVPEGSLNVSKPLDTAISLCLELTPSKEQSVCNEENITRSLQQEWKADIGGFYLDQFEVSVESYLDCYDAGVCTFGPLYYHEQYGWLDDSTLPIAFATYYDAAVYCAWREARLPTDYEWEYAARGPEELTFPWGNTFDDSAANYCDANCDVGIDTSSYEDDGFAELAPVTTYENGQSWVGAYNLAGNVQEWTSISRTSEYSGTGWDNVAKGGNYHSRPYYLASWTGVWLEAEVDLAGLRCARTPNNTLPVPDSASTP